MSDAKNIQDRALEAYAKSPLIKQDALHWATEKLALKKLLEDLSIDTEVTSNVVQIDGMVLTAHYRPFLGNPVGQGLDIDPETEWLRVSIRAHVPCPICKEMRHSNDLKEETLQGERLPTMSVASYALAGGRRTYRVSIAARLGQWLSSPHECQPSETRRIGFRETDLKTSQKAI